MSDTERRFLVTWKRSTSASGTPTATMLADVLYSWRGGHVDVVQVLASGNEQDVTRKRYDGLLSDCLKRIPPAFWHGDSHEETILTYLSAVDDAMELIAENIAARITKEAR